MSRMKAGIAIALVHVLLVCTLGAKLLYDRHHYPRVWVKTRQYDPDLPIRGRYVSLQLEVDAEKPFELTAEEKKLLEDNKVIGTWRNFYRTATLELKNGKLYAVPSEGPGSKTVWIDERNPSKVIWNEQVLYFIPEHAQDPSRQPPGTSLWAEVTVPKKGPPRPIQLATSGPQGWHVLELH